jgi:hypothetical protein
MHINVLVIRSLTATVHVWWTHWDSSGWWRSDWQRGPNNLHVHKATQVFLTWTASCKQGLSIQSTELILDKRDSLKREEPISGRVYVCSDSFHRQNVQRLAGFSCKRELHTCFSPSRLSNFECKVVPGDHEAGRQKKSRTGPPRAKSL